MPSSSLVIREATEADLASIVAHYAPGGSDSPWDPFADLQRVRAVLGPGLLVAEWEGIYAGFLFWYESRRPWYAPNVERYARISDLHIVPAAQGKGVGRTLLRDALSRIRSSSIDTVFLETDETNARARRLYEGEGFVSVAPAVVRYRRDTR